MVYYTGCNCIVDPPAEIFSVDLSTCNWPVGCHIFLLATWKFLAGSPSLLHLYFYSCIYTYIFFLNTVKLSLIIYLRVSLFVGYTEIMLDQMTYVVWLICCCCTEYRVLKRNFICFVAQSSSNLCIYLCQVRSVFVWWTVVEVLHYIFLKCEPRLCDISDSRATRQSISFGNAV